jgi:hypothetical protein
MNLKTLSHVGSYVCAYARREPTSVGEPLRLYLSNRFSEYSSVINARIVRPPSRAPATLVAARPG